MLNNDKTTATYLGRTTQKKENFLRNVYSETFDYNSVSLKNLRFSKINQIKILVIFISLFLLMSINPTIDQKTNQFALKPSNSLSRALVNSVSQLAPFHFVSAEDCSDEGSQCDTKPITEAAASEGIEMNNDGFKKAMADVNKNRPPQNTLKYSLWRNFTMGYMNEGTRAEIADKVGWYEDYFNANYKLNCGTLEQPVSKPYPGQKENNLLWHNCDVPNIATEFVQDVASWFLPKGIEGARSQESYSRFPIFGYSSKTPETVLQNGPQDVTALEVFGYNLRYTTYKGEWDHIKVMTSARALSNFGFMDDLKLGVQVVVNSVVSGLGEAANGFISDLTSVNISKTLMAPARAIKNFLTGGTTATLDTIFDTSDTNVFATQSWYRTDFDATLYNARALSQEEIGTYIKKLLIKYYTSGQAPKTAEVPKELAAFSPDEFAKKGAPSDGTCSYTGMVDNTTSISKETPATENEADCMNWLATEKAAAGNVTAWNPVNVPKVSFETWTANVGWQPIASQYGIRCNIPSASNTTTEKARYETFMSCWNNTTFGWPAAKKKATEVLQNRNNDDWANDKMKASNIIAFLKNENSFTSPQVKYICTKSDGTDMKTATGDYVQLVIGEKGALRMNPLCGKTRSPVQNGLFGNGIIHKQPPPDTRREVLTPGLTDFTSLDENIASAGLLVAVLTTRTSNTLLNLSLNPVFQALGIDTIVAGIITGFRDSLFFPFAFLVICFGALSAFWRAATSRQIAALLKSLLLIFGTFFLGTVLMINPQKTIEWVDNAPSYLEAAIVGAIYNTGNSADDNLCQASTGESTVGQQDFLGSTINFDPAASSRVIMCENWRTFAFNVWVYGQWGTSYDNLKTSEMKNENTSLVGTASVKLGPRTEKNWALYQLDLMTSGTTTTPEPIKYRTVDPNMYRIVDMQAGPNNGAGTDSRYFEAWRGDNPIARPFVSLLGAAQGVAGLISIAIFSFAKIMLSLMTMLMLLFLPFMFLLGLTPNSGRMKLKGYLLQLFSLMIQRVILVAMIAFLMRFVNQVSQTTDNFFISFILIIAICFGMVKLRKEILQHFDKAITSTSGGFAKSFLQDPMRSALAVTPASVRQAVGVRREKIKGQAYGAVGGFMVGGFSGAASAANGVGDKYAQRARVQQLRKGSSAFRIYKDSTDSVKKDAYIDAEKFLNSELAPIKEEIIKDALKNVGDPEERKHILDIINRAFDRLGDDMGAREVRNVNKLIKSIKMQGTIVRTEDEAFEVINNTVNDVLGLRNEETNSFADYADGDSEKVNEIFETMRPVLHEGDDTERVVENRRKAQKVNERSSTELSNYIEKILHDEFNNSDIDEKLNESAKKISEKFKYETSGGLK